MTYQPRLARPTIALFRLACLMLAPLTVAAPLAAAAVPASARFAAARPAAIAAPIAAAADGKADPKAEPNADPKSEKKAERKPPATAPATATPVDAADKVALAANAGKPVAATGTVAAAEWSKSGKVMNVELKDSRLLVVVFERNKEKVNAAFGGDAAKAWAAGAKLTVTGKLGVYGGKAKENEGRPQIVVVDPKQVTVVTPPPAAAADRNAAAGSDEKKGDEKKNVEKK